MHRTKALVRPLTLLCTVSALLWMAGFAAADGAELLVLFNHDAGAGSLTQFEPPVTPEQVCRQLNELEGTSVNVFLFCCNIGGDTFLYPTDVGERCGASVSDWNTVHEYYREELRRATGNLHALYEAGLDPIEIVQRRAGELGIQFWITMRMNEIHEDDKRFASLRSQFKLANRHLLLEKNFPRRTGIGYADGVGYSYAWDYGQSETRGHLLAVFTEMLDRYALDGLELDFMRHPLFFRHGQARDNAPFMTDFLRQVRAEVERVSKEKGRKITLAVRVYPSFAQNEKAGLDVKAWIEQGLVDLVTPMDPGYHDMQPNLREFVEAVQGSDVKIAGGLEGLCRGYGDGHLSKPIAFASASAFLEQGADALYFFNYDCHRRQGQGAAGEYTNEEIGILKKIGDPGKYAYEDKHYFITRDTINRLPEDGGRGQLPEELDPGMTNEFTFTVGDDLQGARSDGTLKAVRLAITFKEYNLKSDHVSIRLNGQSPESKHLHVEGQTVRWPDPPAKQGNNVLSMYLSEDSEQKIRVEKIELSVDY